MFYNCIQELRIYGVTMDSLKIKVYKRVVKEVSEKYEGAEQLINSRTDKICSQEKLFAQEVIYFLCFLVSFLAVK